MTPVRHSPGAAVRMSARAQPDACSWEAGFTYITGISLIFAHMVWELACSSHSFSYFQVILACFKVCFPSPLKWTAVFAGEKSTGFGRLNSTIIPSLSSLLTLCLQKQKLISVTSCLLFMRNSSFVASDLSLLPLHTFLCDVNIKDQWFQMNPA